MRTSFLKTPTSIAALKFNNVVKHAQASEVRVQVAATDSAVEIRIGDNGKGFTVPEAPGRQGNGLRNMRQRLAVHGGRLEILAGGEKGALLVIQLPLSSPSAPPRRNLRLEPRAEPGKLGS